MKKLFLLALVTATISSLASCGNQNTSAEFAPKLDTSTACNLTIRGHYENFEALVTEIKAFQKHYPNVKIAYEYDKDHKKNMLTALSGDTPPDIFFTYSTSNFSDLDPYTEDFAQSSLGLDLNCIRDALIYRDGNGKIPYVPIYTTSFGMLINENLFNKYNVTIPTTYNEFLAACATFQKADPKVYPVLGHKSMIPYPLYFPYFCGNIVGNKEAINALNNKTEGAGEYMRSSLQLAADFMSKGYVDTQECTEKITDDYGKTIMRFYEGDVAMMFAKGSTASGTEKRESQSEAFVANPFTYSFVPVPSTDKGGYFYNTTELCFSVNKQSKNREMSNEFMRFLVSTKELNNMSKEKRMISPCKDLSYDRIYAAFGAMDASRVITPSQLQLLDAADKQVREAATAVCWNGMSVDDAVKNYGSF